MIAYIVNGITGLAENSDMLAQQKKIITSVDVAYFPEFSIESVGSQIGMANHIASTVAYILTWIGTVKMLFPYIKKLGKIKFWIIMGVAMIYYLIEFPLFVLGYFTPSENVDAMTNVLIFSFAGIMSGIIFGAAFLSVARTLRKGSDLKKSHDNCGIRFSSLLYIWICYGFTGRLPSIWYCIYFVYWVILLFDIYWSIFISSYCFPRYNITSVY